MWIVLPFLWALGIVAVVAAGVLLVNHYGRRPKPGEPDPLCGKCSYIIRGLPSAICPECGSDLRDVGTTSSKVAGPPALWTIILVWSLLFVVVVCIVHSVIAMTVPRVSKPLTNTRSLVPASGTYKIALFVSGEGEKGTMPSGVRVSFDNSSGGSTFLRIDFDVTEKTCLVCDYSRGVSVEDRASLKPENLLAWLQTSGVRVDDERVRAEVTELCSLIQTVATGIPISDACERLKYLQSVGVAFYTKAYPQFPVWYREPMPLLCWIVPYVFCVVYLRRKWRQVSVARGEVAE